MRMFRRDDRAQMFRFGRNDPQPAGAGNVEVTLLVDFDSVDGVFFSRSWALRTRGVSMNEASTTKILKNSVEFITVPFPALGNPLYLACAAVVAKALAPATASSPSC
jgi:hypothetical protein